MNMQKFAFMVAAVWAGNYLYSNVQVPGLGAK